MTLQGVCLEFHVKDEETGSEMSGDQPKAAHLNDDDTPGDHKHLLCAWHCVGFISLTFHGFPMTSFCHPHFTDGETEIWRG